MHLDHSRCYTQVYFQFFFEMISSKTVPCKYYPSAKGTSLCEEYSILFALSLAQSLPSRYPSISPFLCPVPFSLPFRCRCSSSWTFLLLSHCLSLCPISLLQPQRQCCLPLPLPLPLPLSASVLPSEDRCGARLRLHSGGGLQRLRQL